MPETNATLRTVSPEMLAGGDVDVHIGSADYDQLLTTEGPITIKAKENPPAKYSALVDKRHYKFLTAGGSTFTITDHKRLDPLVIELTVTPYDGGESANAI